MVVLKCFHIGCKALVKCLGVLVLLLTLNTTVQTCSATKYAGEFLRIGASARALGMGGAVTGMVNDASAVYWNPAGMTQLANAELVLMHAEQFSDLADYDFGAYVLSLEGTGTPGAVGVGVVRFSVPDILITDQAYEDVNGNHSYDHGIDTILPGKFYYDNDTETAVYLSYAKPLSPSLSLGGSLKLISWDLVGHSCFGIGADLGLMWQTSESFSFGARFSDITTTRLFWDGGTRETINPSLFLGGAWQLAVPSLSLDLTTTMDLAFTFDNRETASSFSTGSAGGDLCGGLEAWFKEIFAARVGYQESGVTGGAGFRLRGFGVDYAFVPHDGLGNSHRVSAQYSF